MTEQTEQDTPQSRTVPACIELDDFMKAVARGVAPALQAEEDVSGHSFGTAAVPSFGVGVVLCPPPPPSGPRDVRARGGDRLAKGG